MNRVTIITHFSKPNWPIVNKLSAICKCLDVRMVHCSSFEKLKETLKTLDASRSLFFTDEGLIDFIEEFETSGAGHGSMEVALFIMSSISQVAKKISDRRVVKYLIGGQPGESNGRDLSILIKKFTEGDILDLEKYLAFGCKVNVKRINSNKTKRDAIEAVTNYILRLGDPGYNHPYHEYARRVAELADELLLNGVFDANPRLRGSSHAIPFFLSSEEEILMSWGYDGEYFGISVRDPFGKFNSETIMKYLSTGADASQVLNAKSGGLGLKFIFEKAHQVVTNVKSEKITEVIALMRFSGRILEFENQKKSFYFFDESATTRRIVK